jgi:hypothetical protein
VNCARCQSPLEASDLRCCICAHAVTRAGGGAAAAAPALRARILRCRECAAAISYAAEAQAPRCAFCGAVMEVEQPTDPIEEAELIVPFAVDRASATDSLRRWMRSLGWFRPADLSAAATVEKLEPLHWAAWIFDAEARVTWTADSDADSHRSSWAPHSGDARFAWQNMLVSASRGLTGKETAALTAGYLVDGAQPVAEAQGAASAREGFDTQRSAARARIVAAIESIAEQELTRGFIPGSRFRNVHAAVLLERLTTRRYLLPAWVLAYRYKGSLYRSVVHGQDRSLVIGEAPISWAKILLLVGGVALALLAVLATVIAVLSH